MKRFIIVAVLFSLVIAVFPEGEAAAWHYPWSKEEVKKDVGLNFTGFISTFKSAMGEYAEKCYAAAKTLFYLLFLCQFVWAIIQLCLQESLSFATVVATIVRQIMAGGFFYWFLLDRTILDSIVKSFSALAGESINIGTFAAKTAEICLLIGKYAMSGNGVIGWILPGLTGLAASIIVGYALSTGIGYLAITMLENYIVGSLGVILLGFGGSEYTRNYALSYIKTLFHIGFKMFLTSVILAIGIEVFDNFLYFWRDVDAFGLVVANDSTFQACLVLICLALFFIAIIKVVPQIADTLIAGVSMGIGVGGAAIRSGVGGAAALAGGLAMGAGRVAAGSAGTVGSATGAAANTYHASRQSGKGVGRAVGSAFGSALGHSILGVSATAQNVLRGARNNLADHGILRGHGPQADTIGAAKRQGAGVWSRHKELRAVDEMKQQNSMSAPGAGATGDTPAQAASGTQRGGSRQDFAGIENVSRTGKEALKAPTAEELSKRLGVGGDVNHA